MIGKWTIEDAVAAMLSPNPNPKVKKGQVAAVPEESFSTNVTARYAIYAMVGVTAVAILWSMWRSGRKS
jgi:hypothetical protein